MKIVMGVLLLLVPLLAVAQAPENMLHNLQKMQTCLESVDQTEVRALEQRAQALQATIQSLCSNGQRDKAQQEAMAFGNEVATSKVVKQVAKCTKIMEGMIPEMPLLDFDRDFSDYNICDGQF